MKIGIALLMCIVLIAGLSAGCNQGGPAEASTPSANPSSVAQQDTPPTETVEPVGDANFTPSGKVDPNIKATLVFATWSANGVKYMEELDLEGRFQKYYPNVNIEYELSKNDSDYWESMTIRATANELPDIMLNKPFTISRYGDYLLDLTDACASVIADNTLAAGYALNGKVLAIPTTCGNDFVYYWSDMFDAAGVSVPQNWPDFVSVCKTLQDYYGKDDPDFAALMMPAKDEWPTYPFMEFMPPTISGVGDTWDRMVKQDRPFDPGTDVYISYKKVYDLFSSGVCGKDPLGIGWDQGVALFAQKKAAIMAAGSWLLQGVEENTDSMEGLKSFYLPTRDSNSDPFWLTTQGDSMMSVTSQSKNPDLAMDFINFYFSAGFYPDIMATGFDDSPMKSFPQKMDPISEEAVKLMPDPKYAVYNGGGAEFLALQAETKFDYKKLGAQMFSPGFNLDAELNSLNDAWTKARADLGIK